MSKRFDFRLNVLSQIDERIVERNTQKRIKLLAKPLAKTKKQIMAVVSLAACILIVVGAFFGILANQRQVPIYQGMTVSSTNGGVPSLAERNVAFSLSLDPRPATLLFDVSETDELHTDPLATEAEETTDGSSLDVNGAGREIYYAEPNSTIYITVHLSNPDAFEIQSFTLNGKKYASYMFEEGSDLENLILKVDVGDTVGILSYTLDAIKYIDGTEIKDVRMEGDKTVLVGVYNAEKVAALAEHTETVGFNELSVSLTVRDELELIPKSGGYVEVVLYDGSDAIVATKRIESATADVTFDGLKTDTAYRYEIVACYDCLDGSGFGSYTLYQADFSTRKIVMFSNVTTTQSGVSFAIVWEEDYSSKALTSLALYQNGELLRELALDATNVAELLSNNAYTLVAEYQNNGASERVSYDFRTHAKTAPTVAVEDMTKTQTSIGFDVRITDPDQLCTVTKIELLQGETVVATAADVTAREFVGLLSNNAYTVRVTYTYDLGDGEGIHTEQKTATVKTLAKTAPTVAVEYMTRTQTSIGFDVRITDPDQLCTVTKIELLQGETVVATAADVTAREFVGLLSNNAYTVRVTYTYDLGDGEGIHTGQKTATVKTLAKTAPIVAVEDMTKTQTSIGFDVRITDPDQLCTVTKIELLQGETVVATAANVTAREFVDLIPYTEYTVRISYEYDLNDGNGILRGEATQTARTRPILELLNFRILNTTGVITGDTLLLEAAVNNPSGLLPQTIVINGKAYPVSAISNANKVRLELVIDGALGGDTEFVLSSISFDGATEDYTLSPTEGNTANCFINGELKILDVKAVNQYGETPEYFFAGDEVYALITFDNPTGYRIKSILPPYDYQEPWTDFVEITDNTVKIRLTENRIGSIAGCTYENDYVGERTLILEEEDFLEINFYYFQKRVEIRTADELKSMRRDGFNYYCLMNDIDLSGRTDLQYGSFDGMFDGNGHSISGYTVVGNFDQAENVKLSLFSDLGNSDFVYFKNLNITDVLVIAPGTNFGGLATCGDYTSSLQEMYFENVTFSGEVSAGIAGGFVGENTDDELYFKNCSVSGTINGTVAQGKFAALALNGDGLYGGAINDNNWNGD